VATSIIFFLMPVAGHCKTCDNQDEEHCIQGGWVTAAGLNTREQVMEQAWPVRMGQQLYDRVGAQQYSTQGHAWTKLNL
jgi:hypothetical protein